jgi:hypothetical protein
MLLEIRKSGKISFIDLCGMVGFLLLLPYFLTPEPTVVLTCLALVGLFPIALMVFIPPSGNRHFYQSTASDVVLTSLVFALVVVQLALVVLPLE